MIDARPAFNCGVRNVRKILAERDRADRRAQANREAVGLTHVRSTASDQTLCGTEGRMVEQTSARLRQGHLRNPCPECLELFRGQD